jgi:hypothetical protein
VTSDEALLERFARLRPGDPDGPEREAALARVAARVALRRRAAPARAERVRGRAWRVAAAVLLFALLAPSLDRPPPGERRAATGDGWDETARRALAGDAVARHRLVRGGGEAREALLRAALEGRAGALALWGVAGGVRTRAEARAVAGLLATLAQRDAAAAVLAQDASGVGPMLLGEWLEAHPADGGAVVRELARLAERSRRALALDLLRRGARAGSPEAAVAALAAGGATGVGDWLASLEPGLLADERVGAALRDAPATVRARVLRLAREGGARALDLAVAAGLPEVVPVLEARALGPEDAPAAAARLGRMAGVDARLALARALDGPAADEARAALALTDADGVDALAERARRSSRDAGAAARALAACGADGWRALEALADEPRLRPGVLALLATHEAPDAGWALARLGRREGALGREAVVALGRRLRHGATDAAALLVEAMDGPHARSVLQALRESGERGRDALEAAESRERAGARAPPARPAAAF